MDVESSGCEPPIVRGDLQHHASGCYSAHSQIKRLNRLAENALLAAEKYSVMAGALAGAPFPEEALERAWKDVLFNQFHDILAGTMEKAANGQEEPMQNWVDLSGTHLDGGCGAGLTVLNDGKYSAAALGYKLSLTVLRSPVFSHHVPMELNDPPVGYRFMDQGWQSFRYALVPHGGQWRAIHPVRRGMEVNQGPSLVTEAFHTGDLSAKAGVLAVDAPNVVATCLKKARGSDSIILRLCETEGKPTAALLEVYGAPEPVPVELRPYEIRTLAISPQTREIITVDLLEWEPSENR